jgi:hypothetical protein
LGGFGNKKNPYAMVFSNPIIGFTVAQSGVRKEIAHGLEEF